MIVNIQFEEAANLLWELLAAIPEDRRKGFPEKVNRVASALFHPPLDGAVVLALSSDGADQPTVTL